MHFKNAPLLLHSHHHQHSIMLKEYISNGMYVSMYVCMHVQCQCEISLTQL